MGYSGSPATVVRNNRNLLKKVGLFKNKERTKRILIEKEINPNIKNMSKKELKIYREALQKEANFKLKAFWIVFIGLFLSLLIFGISKL